LVSRAATRFSRRKDKNRSIKREKNVGKIREGQGLILDLSLKLYNMCSRTRRNAGKTSFLSEVKLLYGKT